MSKHFAQVVVGLPVEGPFDYSVPVSMQSAIAVGSRVSVSFGPQRMVGYVTALRSQSQIPRVKDLLAVPDNAAVIDELTMKLAGEFSEYYGCSLGEALESALPAFLRTPRSVTLNPSANSSPAAEKGSVRLCLDPGGEKRWPFLLDEIKKTLSAGRGVIVLVPEVVQIKNILPLLQKETGEPVAVLDKQWTAREEWEQWVSVREGRTRVVIGTRSAVFAPVRPLGLIVIHDEENMSFKQEQSPFYHVRDVAEMRQGLEGASVIYASAAPSAEVWHQAGKNKETLIHLEPDKWALMQIIDLTNYKPRKRSALSFPLINRIQETLAEGGKVVLFLNRRLFNEAEFQKIPDPSLAEYLRNSGDRIRQLERDLAKFFPYAKVARFDGDSTDVPATANVIVATQAVFRVLNQMKVSLIAALEIDAELNRLDFRSAQRTFTLLMHLRQSAGQRLLVQTFQMSNYCLKAAVKPDLAKFYREELKYRRELQLPPFHHLIEVACRGQKEEAVAAQAAALFQYLKEKLPGSVELMDPQLSAPGKMRGRTRMVVVLKGKSVKPMVRQIKSALKAVKRQKSVIVTINVDP